MPKQKKTVAYKGFDQDLKCRDFQYEVSKTYEHEGAPVRCTSAGFHACKNPFDVWSYYDLSNSRFAKVTAHGDLSEDSDDSKFATAKLTVEAELTLPEFIKAGIAYLLKLTKGKDESGYSAQIGSSGDDAQIGSSGNSAQIGSSGNSAQIGSSGNSAQIGSSGYSARIGSSGNYARIGSSGDDARIGSSGYSAQIGSSGNSAQIGSSGNYARIGSSGDDARIGSSGYSAQIAASGKKSVVASAGHNARVKAAKGTWVSVAEYKNGECVGFATGKIGEDGLKPDTWYEARGGKLVECIQ